MKAKETVVLGVRKSLAVWRTAVSAELVEVGGVKLMV